MTYVISFLIACSFFALIGLLVWAIENEGKSKWADRALWALGVILAIIVMVAIVLGINDIITSPGSPGE